MISQLINFRDKILLVVKDGVDGQLSLLDHLILDDQKQPPQQRSGLRHDLKELILVDMVEQLGEEGGWDDVGFIMLL